MSAACNFIWLKLIQSKLSAEARCKSFPWFAVPDSSQVWAQHMSNEISQGVWTWDVYVWASNWQSGCKVAAILSKLEWDREQHVSCTHLNRAITDYLSAQKIKCWQCMQKWNFWEVQKTAEGSLNMTSIYTQTWSLIFDSGWLQSVCFL